jgi:hypothetical protein
MLKKLQRINSMAASTGYKAEDLKEFDLESEKGIDETMRFFEALEKKKNEWTQGLPNAQPAGNGIAVFQGDDSDETEQDKPAQKHNAFKNMFKRKEPQNDEDLESRFNDDELESRVFLPSFDFMKHETSSEIVRLYGCRDPLRMNQSGGGPFHYYPNGRLI